jgi:hypothetical protein
MHIAHDTHLCQPLMRRLAWKRAARHNTDDFAACRQRSVRQRAHHSIRRAAIDNTCSPSDYLGRQIARRLDKFGPRASP